MFIHKGFSARVFGKQNPCTMLCTKGNMSVFIIVEKWGFYQDLQYCRYKVLGRIQVFTKGGSIFDVRCFNLGGSIEPPPAPRSAPEVTAKVPFRQVQFVSPMVQFTLQEFFFFTSSLHEFLFYPPPPITFLMVRVLFELLCLRLF